MIVASDDGKGGRRRVSARISRRLVAVLALDVFGYSALMASDEERTHLRIGAELARVGRAIERFDGRRFASTGDGLLAEFAEATDAFRCARRVQQEAERRNAQLPADRRILFRIGLNWGQIVEEGGRIGGTTVNVAARLERLARPGGICLSEAIYLRLPPSLAVAALPLGRHQLRNLSEPVMLHEVPPANVGQAAPMATEEAGEALSAPERQPSLAVLPFRTQNSEQDAYFSSGMVDDIIRVLGGLQHLVVVSRSSTLSYGGAPDLRRVASELDVRYVLHGSVQRAGERLRITVELDDAATTQTIWSGHFDSDLVSVFELQDSIAVQTAAAIAPWVRERELRRSLRKNGNTISAYDLSLQALSRFYANDRAVLDEARALLREAIALDPGYAKPRTYLAYLHILRRARGWAGDDPDERLDAYNLAREATALDGSDALALAIYGHLHAYLFKGYETGLGLLDRAVSVSPSCALAWCFGAFVCGFVGEPEAALDRATRAIRLTPIGPEVGAWHEHAMSQTHYLLHQYDEAIEWGYGAARHGGQSSNLRCLTAALVAAGRLEEAQSVAEQILQADPHFQCGTFRVYTPLRGDVADLFVDRLRRAGLPG